MIPLGRCVDEMICKLEFPEQTLWQKNKRQRKFFLKIRACPEDQSSVRQTGGDYE